MGLNFDQKNLASLLPELSREQIEQIVLQQATQIQTLQERISSLEKEILELKQNPPSLTAPFRRKKGHKGSFRQPPPPTEIIDVPLECVS